MSVPKNIYELDEVALGRALFAYCEKLPEDLRISAMMAQALRDAIADTILVYLQNLPPKETT